MSLGHVSSRQLTLLMSYLLAGKALFMFPTIIAQKAGSAAWISILVAAALGLLGTAGWVAWCGATNDTGFVPSLRLTLGRFLGDLLAMLLVVIFTIGNSLNIRSFVGGAIIGIVPDFPIDVLLYIFILTTIYAAWLGLEPVARTGGIFFTPTLLSIGLISAGMYRSFDLANLSPMWGLGMKNTLVQGALNTGIFAAIPALAVMKSFVRKHSDVASSGVSSVLIATAILVGTVVAVAGVFPYPMNTRNVEPLGVMARAVYFGRFFQRLEAFFTFTWFFAACVQASFTFLVTLIMLSQLCNARTLRPFVPALAVLTFGIAGLPANTLSAGQLMDGIITSGGGNVTVALGWLLFLVATLRGVKAGRPR